MLQLLEKILHRTPAPRTRRRIEDLNAFQRELQFGWFTKIAIFILFVLGLALLIFSGNSHEPVQKFLISLLIFATAIAHLWVNHPNTLHSNQRLFLVLGILFLQLAAIKLLLIEAQRGILDPTFFPMLVPYAFAPLCLSVLLGKNHGLYAAIFCSLWTAFLLRQIEPILLVISLIAGFVAVHLTFHVRRRATLIRAGFFTGLATLVLCALFGLIGPINFSNLIETNWERVAWQAFATLAAGFTTSILVSGLLPILESLFGVTTEISWLEMADLNHPLLKRLSLEAPGSYHHSLAVANLSEAAAEKVGANPTICRVASYFHDIGKLVKPEYFTENISNRANPHDELTPTMSALIIIAHVKEGVDLALKHKLNPIIIDVIREHHGTSLVSFFYQRALRQFNDASLGGKITNIRTEDLPPVNESNFRYPGPKPSSKESAIISLADAVESASRSLERPTPQRIADLVNDIIQERLKDGQLDDAPLTLQELKKIAESFCFTLQSMLHSRVAYPKKRETAENDSDESQENIRVAV